MICDVLCFKLWPFWLLWQLEKAFELELNLQRKLPFCDPCLAVLQQVATLSWKKYCRFHIGLSVWWQIMSKCGKNKKVVHKMQPKPNMPKIQIYKNAGLKDEIFYLLLLLSHDINTVPFFSFIVAFHLFKVLVAVGDLVVEEVSFVVFWFQLRELNVQDHQPFILKSD